MVEDAKPLRSAPAGASGAGAPGAMSEPPRPSPLRPRGVAQAGLDDGRVWMKVAGDTRAGSFALAADTDPGAYSSPPAASYQTDGVTWHVWEGVADSPVGPIASVPGTVATERGRPGSIARRVLVHHALVRAGFSPRAVQLGVAIAPSLYFSALHGTHADLQVAERIVRNLGAPVSALGADGVASPAARVRSVAVFARGIAAWVDASFDSRGSPVRNLAQPATVVDIGEHSTEIVTVLPGWKLDRLRSGGCRVGAASLRASTLAAIAGLAPAARGPGTPAELLGALERGEPLPAAVAEAILVVRRDACKALMREVHRRIGRARDVQAVLVAGGGATALATALESVPGATLAADPVLANARGMLKYMRFVI